MFFLKKITITKPNIPTSVTLQFRANLINVTQISNENVRWTNCVREQIHGTIGTMTIWYVFICFKEPTHYGQIIVDAGNAQIPEYHVTSQTNFTAIVRFSGDIGNIVLTIKCIAPNRGG